MSEINRKNLGYIGISWINRDGRWRVRINNNGKRICLGQFHKLIDAINVYDKKAIELFGNKAKTNKQLIIKGLLKEPTEKLDRIYNKIEDLPNETWKDIRDYEGLYKISNLGRIKSLERIDYSGHKLEENLISICKSGSGYMCVNLCKNGIQKSHRLHRIIAITFIPNPNNYNQINHLDGIKLNNRIDNLEWCDNSRNQRHAFEIGLKIMPKGENHWGSKLTKNDILKIRKLYNDGFWPSDIQGEFENISVSNISQIARNKTWKHID